MYKAESWEEYLRCAEPNFMTRLLCGILPHEYPVPGDPTNDYRDLDWHTPTLGPQHLECAKERLRRFNVVVTVETLSFADSVFRHELGWEEGSANSRKGSMTGERRQLLLLPHYYLLHLSSSSPYHHIDLAIHLRDRDPSIHFSIMEGCVC